jgi:tyrosine-protein phosphatase SIW14
VLRLRVSAPWVAGICVMLTGCAKPPAEAVERFRVVEPGKLSAGARLSADGLRWLKSRGTGTILNLERELLETVPGEVKKERARAQAFGLSFVHLPLHPVAAPTISQLDAAVSVITSAGGPVFVHCDHGSDRTGMVIAAYRIKVQRWPATRAYQELIDSGFHSRVYFWWKERLFEYARQKV